MLESFIKIVVQESLKSDQRRYDLARKVYDFLVKGVYRKDEEDVSMKSKIDKDGDIDVTIIVRLHRLDSKVFPEKSMFVLFITNKDHKTANASYFSTKEDVHVVELFRSNFQNADGLSASEIDSAMQGASKESGYKSFVFKTGSAGEKIYQDILNILEEKRSTLIHEISHFVDDLVLLGREKFSASLDSLLAQSSASAVSGSKKYYSAGHEMNARWSQVLDHLRSEGQYWMSKAEAPFEDWLKAAKGKIEFDELPVKKQREFIKRLYELWDSPREKPGQKQMSFKERVKFLRDRRLEKEKSAS